MAREFGSEIAVPLKEAIAQTEAVTLVASLSATGMTSLKIGGNPNRKTGEAIAPGEVLFVGFNQPTYEIEEMNRVMAEVAHRVTEPRDTLNPAVLWYREQQIKFGSIRFPEVCPKALRVTTTNLYTAENPFLQDLLNGDGIEVGKEYEKERFYDVTRHTEAFFYPSIAVANFAVELKQAYEENPSRFLARGTFGAIETIAEEDFIKLAIIESQPGEQQELVAAITSKYIRRPQLTPAS